MRIQFIHKYEQLISTENLLAAWQEFKLGKSKKKDVQQFALHLIDNIVQLHNDLANKTYMHGGYYNFSIADPKPRQIHKAAVRDRVLHHAIYGQLYPFFDNTFIADSYSCRVHKGTHKALNRFQTLASKVSKNQTRTCWVLKCDIRKFFASINHEVLLELLNIYILDKDIMWLLEMVISSFSFGEAGVGLPLGNLTSQLFCNVYMNQFDQFIKHKLKARHYVRYADDFAFLSSDREWLTNQMPKITEFLENRLKLSLHPDKVFIKTFASGVDFLGWVHFSDHRIFRTASKKRMRRRIAKHPTQETVQSYLGLLAHGNTHTLQQEVVNQYGLLRDKL